MSELSENISKRINEIDHAVSQLEKRIAAEPEGRLRVSKNAGRYRYYHTTKGNSPSGRYLKRSDKDLIRRLARKDYELKLLESFYAEREALSKAESFYEQSMDLCKGKSNHFFHGPEELIWRNLNEGKRLMAEPFEPDDEFFLQEWMMEEYEGKEFSDDAPEYYTGSGIRVRSKTELIIAEMLEKKNVPFYYEKPLYLNGYGIIHPDFTVLNRRERKTLYWEHMGMMDDADYCRYALEKIEHYEAAGYYPGKNLILSHETSLRPVKTRIIEKLIDTFLV